jgi:hypothetical protein
MIAFAEKLSLVHGTKIKLIGSFASTKIATLFRCECGNSWSALPSNLIYGRKSGCPVCSFREYGLSNRLDRNDVLDRIKTTHSGKIRLVSSFETTKSVATFECEHGHSWNAPVQRILKGSGCRKCAGARNNISKQRPIAEVAAEIESISGGKIKMIGPYNGRGKRSEFVCDLGHRWKTSVHNVMVGRGCPGCAKGGFDPSKPGILYYLRVKDDVGNSFYKIGITNLSIEERFKTKSDRERIKIVAQWRFEDGGEAAQVELDVLRKFKSSKYSGPPILTGGGNSELFQDDVLLLDEALQIQFRTSHAFHAS